MHNWLRRAFGYIITQTVCYHLFISISMRHNIRLIMYFNTEAIINTKNYSTRRHKGTERKGKKTLGNFVLFTLRDLVKRFSTRRKYSTRRHGDTKFFLTQNSLRKRVKKTLRNFVFLRKAFIILRESV